MQTSRLGTGLKFGIVTLLFVVLATCVAVSQEVSMALLQPGLMEPVPAPASAVKALPATPVRAGTEEHKFWDRENTALFVTVAAFCAADFAVTRDNLSHGGRELNPLTRPFSGSTAGLAVNFAGETAGVIGISYWLHKTGHHKLERVAPLVNFGASAFAVTYGLTHR